MFPLGNVTWTYGVSWIDANDEESDMSLSTRWEPYLSMFYRYPDEIHIFSIINSTIIVIFLTVRDLYWCLVVRNVMIVSVVFQVMLVMIRQRALKYFQGTDLTTPLVGEGTPTPGSTRTWCCTRVPVGHGCSVTPMHS